MIRFLGVGDSGRKEILMSDKIKANSNLIADNKREDKNNRRIGDYNE